MEAQGDTKEYRGDESPTGYIGVQREHESTNWIHRSRGVPRDYRRYIDV